MTQYRGVVEGGRGSVSRLGHKTSGLTVKANGWHLGITVEASYRDGKDVFEVYKTGGSANGSTRELIATVA